MRLSNWLFWVTLLSSLTNNEDYHPIHCTVMKYNFAFLRKDKEYQVHGLWPDQCQECPNCSYPTCCDMEKFSHFTMPSDTQFINQSWYGGQSTHVGHICGLTTHTLFEHEVLKHASCMGFYAEEYMILVEKLFNKYISHVKEVCRSGPNCEIYLNSDFSLL